MAIQETPPANPESFSEADGLQTKSDVFHTSQESDVEQTILKGAE